MSVSICIATYKLTFEGRDDSVYIITCKLTFGGQDDSVCITTCKLTFEGRDTNVCQRLYHHVQTDLRGTRPLHQCA